MTDLVGRQFGNYRLIRLLGQGGFAEVYLGQHVHLSSQQAALKILSTQLNGQDTEAFKREAETIAALIHPHIVRVFDFDIQEQSPFLVMDYAPHGSLRQRHVRGEQVPLPTVVSYAQQIGQGLAYAHEKMVIHRDVKPDNMLIDIHNNIVISDFGIATIVHNTSSQIAQAINGTVPYMAPEQFQGQVRAASDQYALAITLYEWLTGAYPFTGSLTEIAYKHATAAPAPLREKCPMLPLQVEQVILTALAKDPKDRFGSVLAFVNALTQASQKAASIHATPAFPVMYPIQLPVQTFTPTNTNPGSSKDDHLRPTEANWQPVRPAPLQVDERKKKRTVPIVLSVLGLIVILALVVSGGSILAAIGHPSAPPPAASIPTIAPATPVLTPTAVPDFISAADFTVQQPQTSNVTLLRNDASFQNDHSVLWQDGQVVIAFPSQASARTVTVIISALVSQQSPNKSGFAPINLLCNGQVIVSDFIMPGNGYSANTTSIQVPTQNLSSGTNQIELQVSNTARTFFWLYKLEVQQAA